MRAVPVDFALAFPQVTLTRLAPLLHRENAIPSDQREAFARQLCGLGQIRSGLAGANPPEKQRLEIETCATQPGQVSQAEDDDETLHSPDHTSREQPLR